MGEKWYVYSFISVGERDVDDISEMWISNIWINGGVYKFIWLVREFANGAWTCYDDSLISEKFLPLFGCWGMCLKG